ncbi:unnamed protein product [Bursaphelenchus okinawaensis]|uniref:Retrotransposon gag domain-containing protein n=1 Tax=Bursaphelenchus okinawaensis TaxID=465554 RepID=A0A811LU27_9BILA|nr:unnamed protein product [Bursaphelenchus okinawaensis]CAG9128059.1 unnamed protein product [Bursaphelenchus okinawaensis]
MAESPSLNGDNNPFDMQFLAKMLSEMKAQNDNLASTLKVEAEKSEKQITDLKKQILDMKTHTESQMKVLNEKVTCSGDKAETEQNGTATPSKEKVNSEATNSGGVGTENQSTPTFRLTDTERVVFQSPKSVFEDNSQSSASVPINDVSSFIVLQSQIPKITGDDKTDVLESFFSAYRTSTLHFSELLKKNLVETKLTGDAKVCYRTIQTDYPLLDTDNCVKLLEKELLQSKFDPDKAMADFQRPYYRKHDLHIRDYARRIKMLACRALIGYPKELREREMIAKFLGGLNCEQAHIALSSQQTLNPDYDSMVRVACKVYDGLQTRSQVKKQNDIYRQNRKYGNNTNSEQQNKVYPQNFGKLPQGFQKPGM